MSEERVAMDVGAYTEGVQASRAAGGCFICDIVARTDSHHHIVFEDEAHIAFLNRYPTQRGYVLVAPREHREQVTADFSLDEYVAMQRLVYGVSEAVRVELGAARMYLLSLGSNEGNAHVHWHVAPLPPGVPYERQQGEALRAANGIVAMDDRDQAALARRIGARMASV